MKLQELIGNAAQGGATFDILQPDSFFIPFGNYPHQAGLQIFDVKAAKAIASNHNGLLGKLARKVGMTYPVYIGHPDLPGSKDSDKRSYGWIETMNVEDDGLRLGVKWSPAGQELVTNAHFKFYSPLWWTATTAGGIRPTALKSMGLTNDPNIPVPALANESSEETPTEINDMNPEILALLGLPDTATPEDVLAAITDLRTAADASTSEKIAEETSETSDGDTPPLQEEIPVADAAPPCDPPAPPEEKKISDGGTPPLQEESEADALKKKLKAAANVSVQAAVTSGRLTPAAAEGYLERILAANDIVTELGTLAALPQVVKVASQTGPLGAAKVALVTAHNDASANARSERAVAVANEFAATNQDLSDGERKRIAWERAQRKNPDLFQTKATAE